MATENVIDKCLRKIASGDTAAISQLLTLLSDEVLYTPVLNFQNVGDKRGTNKIKVASFSAEDRNFVPAFTREEYFLSWSDGKYQCFSVAGGDLALTLPKQTWLVINPGSSDSIELSPEAIERLSKFDPDFEMEFESESVDSVVEQEEVDLPDIDIERITADVYHTLLKYPEVEEGYLQFTKDETTRAVLGLLTARLDAEKRFLLIDQIAEISRMYFGAVGAIEVYDDLDVTTSSSWELFNALNPFYLKGGVAEPASVVVQKQTISDAFKKPAVAARKPVDEQGSSQSLSWRDLKKRGSKLFDSIVRR